MPIELLQPVAPLIAATLFALALLAFLVSLRFFRKSRTDFYWRRRRSAGQRGWRLFLWSIIFSFTSGLICVVSGVAGLLNSQQTPTAVVMIVTATETPGASPSVTATELPTETIPAPTASFTAANTDVPPTNTPIPATATRMPSATPSRTPTQTATLTASITGTATATGKTPSATLTPSKTLTPSITFTPTSTPTDTSTPTPTHTETSTRTSTPTFTQTVTKSPTPTETATGTPTSTLTPTITITPSETLVPSGSTAVLESSVTPSGKSNIAITSLDIQVSSEGQPVHPATTFKSGFQRIFFFVSFSGMQNGVLWRRELVKDNEVIEKQQYLWGMAEGGLAFFFFGQEDGFKPGRYQIRVYIGSSGEPAASASFIVS